MPTCSFLLFGIISSAVGFEGERTAPPELLDDAELHDVYFLDADRGWAVGDRGVVWATADGGREWQLQNSGTQWRLDSVCFVDELHGWIVGGRAIPYSPTSVGIVLRTSNGGQSWTRVPNLHLPALTKVKFVDERRGWAVGRQSAQYPSAAFRTDDGGKTWNSVGGRTNSRWLAGDFVAGLGVLMGHGNVAGTVKGSNVTYTHRPNSGLRRIHALSLADDLIGWSVGDGGLIWKTTDGGQSWQQPPAMIPSEMSGQFDFHAVATFQNHCWIAGSPGTCVFHSSDGGQTWKRHQTGQSVPIRDIAFVDEQRGWAVGALGSIIVTTDGGQSWRPQRAHRRSAVLGLYSEPEHIPLELFARLSGNLGYLGVAEVVTRRDIESAERHAVPRRERVHATMLHVGGSGADTNWKFPLRQPGLDLPLETVLETWNHHSNGTAIERIEESLVRRIRQWQPDVVVTESVDDTANPLGKLMVKVVSQAIEKASDTTAYPHQIELAGLQPWRVRQAFRTTAEIAENDISLATAQFAPRLGSSLAEAASLARSILSIDHIESADTLRFVSLDAQESDDERTFEFFSGIVLRAGGAARRRPHAPNAASLAALKAAAQQQRTLHRMFEQSVRGTQAHLQLLAQLEQMLQGMTDTTATHVLYQLSDNYQTIGKLDIAAEVLQLLVQKYGESELAGPAWKWLLTYYGSSEATWWMHGTGQIQSASVDATTTVVQTKHQFSFAGYNNLSPSATTEFQTDAPQKERIRQESFLVEQQKRSTWSLQIGEYLSRTHPLVHADPLLRYTLASLQRRQGEASKADGLMRALARRGPEDVWSGVARGEFWLKNQRANSLVEVYRCVETPEKPLLDGKLHDAFWKSTEVAELRSKLEDDTEWPAVVMMAYDSEYLYIAVHCRKSAFEDYTHDERTRERDADLQAHDRVHILLDIDRDRSSYYELTLDSRGWTNDRCLGLPAWNPKWFVASSQDEKSWTAEAAIPWQELAPKAPHRKQAWTVAFQRVAPRSGFQSWNRPAAIESLPSGMGLLIFDTP